MKVPEKATLPAFPAGFSSRPLACRPTKSRQRFTGRHLLPSDGLRERKNAPVGKKKVAFRGWQRHNVSSPGASLLCWHPACIPPGLPSLRLNATARLSRPALAACFPQVPGPRSALPHAAGLACPLNHTVGTPNDGAVLGISIPAGAGRENRFDRRNRQGALLCTTRCWMNSRMTSSPIPRRSRSSPRRSSTPKRPMPNC